jgi:hypothetical protein
VHLLPDKDTQAVQVGQPIVQAAVVAQAQSVAVVQGQLVVLVATVHLLQFQVLL